MCWIKSTVFFLIDGFGSEFRFIDVMKKNNVEHPVWSLVD